ncbi:MAG: ABC transporter permease subunit [Deltaproteobacteria bacterium]
MPFDVAAGLTHWAIVMAAVLIVVFVTALLTSVLALGLAGPWEVVVQILGGVRDLLGTSPRRCLALAQLTFREAWRKKTLWVFAVFAVLFLFAGWFLSDVTADADLQVKNYVSFVLKTISWLILPVALLLACWGLPEDIKARSLHTVVTKPVRRHEIVLGRILGYSAIGGLVLAVMGGVGFVWINRQLPEAKGSQLTARVPVYGEISFVDNQGSSRDQQGKQLTEGVNTGDENMFRSFIEGNTKARAVWEFSNVDLSRLNQQGGLVLESSFQSFRTFKGNIEKQLRCQFELVNESKDLRVPLAPFEVNEFRRNVYDVQERNKTLEAKNGKTVELADLVDGGKLRVEVACLSSAQFLGMARPDLFIRLPDRSFAASYFKCLFNIGLMMFMVVVLGVISGCFVKGPVATILTGSVVIIGKVWHAFLESLVTGRVGYNPNLKMSGTGLFDSLYRIPTHMNPNVELGESFVHRMIKALDNIELNGLWAVQHLFPDFGSFDTTEYVANAYDVPWAEATLPSLMTTVGFCLPWILVGYFSLRLRELEAK